MWNYARRAGLALLLLLSLALTACESSGSQGAGKKKTDSCRPGT